MRLSELITKRKAELGLSFQGIADRAAEAGYQLSRANVHWFTRDEMKEWPTPETITALAHALDVPVAEVIDATAESLGIEVERVPTDSASVRAWVALTEHRSPEEVERLLQIARTVAEGFDQAGTKRDRKATKRSSR